jgi:Ca-activated chloride channel family protein
MISGITFAQPQFLWLLTLIPVMVAFYFFYLRKKTSPLTYSGFRVFNGIRPTFRQRFRYLPFVIKLLAFSLAIVALARPQSSTSGQNVTTEGIDIMMTLDVSSSMLAEDLKPNRIDAAKKVAEDFINSRPNDRIGLVIFGGESFTQCPLTTDHAV